MKAISGIVLVFLLGAMFVSLFHMSMGMDMSGGMSDCPFMAHEEVLCPMNLADHIDAWKTAFVAIAPTIVFLLTVTVAFIVSVAPFLFRPKRNTIPILYRQFLQRRYSYSYRPLQELFSNGILHPKLF